MKVGKLKFDWRHVSDTRVKALSVVEDFDVLEDGLSCCVARCECDSVYEFFIDCSKETLGNGVVPTVAFATHAWLEAVDFECQLIVRASVLAATVRVMNETWRGASASNRYVECIEREKAVDVGAHRPTNNLMSTQVNEHGEVQPTL